MEVKKNEGNEKLEPKQYSYEQLVDMTNQMQEQGQKLFEENQALKQQGIIIRLNFLFNILKEKDSFNTELIVKVADEIEKALYPDVQDLAADNDSK